MNAPLKQVFILYVLSDLGGNAAAGLKFVFEAVEADLGSGSGWT